MKLFNFLKMGKEAEKHQKPREDYEKQLIDSINEFRAQQARVREAFYEENDEKINVHHEKINKAKMFIESTGLDQSFPKVFDTIQHWGSWSKNDNWGEDIPFKVEQIYGENESLGNWRISFIYDEHPFTFSCTRDKDSDMDLNQYIECALSFDKTKVCEIQCYYNLDDLKYEWKYSSVKYYQPGDWVKYLVEMHELIKLYEIKKARQFGEECLTKEAKNLPD